eukprot:scaffold7029_cov375-Pinguiococcus_pyrenoidosus.AAC.10
MVIALSAAQSMLYAGPFFIPCLAEFTMRELMFWSRKKSPVRKAAGTTQAIFAHRGTIAMSANRCAKNPHPMPSTAVGMEDAIVATPNWLTDGNEHRMDTNKMHSGGPKSRTTFRSFGVPKGLFGTLEEAPRTSTYVSRARLIESVAIGKFVLGPVTELASVRPASYMKFTASRELKTSSVNCVQCRIRAGAPPAASKKRKADVQTPTYIWCKLKVVESDRTW